MTGLAPRKISDLEWDETLLPAGTLYRCNPTGVLYIQVLKRMTGLCFDKTSFSTILRNSISRRQWEACDFSVLDYPDLTLEEAVDLIQKKAETCRHI